MNRKELIRRVAEKMKAENIRKPIFAKKHVFHISDDNGNKKDFIVKQSDNTVKYTTDDVELIIENCIAVIKEALSEGDQIRVPGFGILGLHYRKPRSTFHPITGEFVAVDGRYVPKFDPARDLKMCAKVYELGLPENKDTNNEDESLFNGDL